MTRDGERTPRKNKTAGVRVVRKGEASRTPLWRQVYAQLRESIGSGELPVGAPIPASRTLARELKVSRNTVEGALLKLAAEGLIERRVGSGTRVGASIVGGDAAVQVAGEREFE